MTTTPRFAARTVGGLRVTMDDFDEESGVLYGRIFYKNGVAHEARWMAKDGVCIRIEGLMVFAHHDLQPWPHQQHESQ